MKIRIALVLICALCWSSCDTLTGLTSFINCVYDFQNLSNPSVGEINLEQVKSVEQLNPTALLRLSTALVSGKLPLSVTLNIRAANPNGSVAQIEGLEWSLNQNNKLMVSGMLTERVQVPAHGQSIIPVRVQMDLLEVFKGESKENIFGFVNSLLNFGTSSSDLTLKIKPKIDIAGQKIVAGSFTIK